MRARRYSLVNEHENVHRTCLDFVTIIFFNEYPVLGNSLGKLVFNLLFLFQCLFNVFHDY